MCICKNLLCILSLLILFNFSKVHAQKIDRIGFIDSLKIKSSSNPDFEPFVSVTDSFSFLINDQVPGKLYFLKFDENDVLTKSRVLDTDTFLIQVGISSFIYYKSFLYFISPTNGGLFGKMDKNLNLIWFKRLDPIPGIGSVSLNTIIGLDNRLFISSNTGNSFIISKYNLNGIHGRSKRYKEASSYYSFSAYNFPNLVQDDTFMYAIVNSNLIGGGLIKFHILKFDKNLYLSNSRAFERNGRGIIKRFEIIENNNFLKITEAVTNSGPVININSMLDVKIDKDLQIVAYKRWEAYVNGQSTLGGNVKFFHLKNGNRYFDIFPINDAFQSGSVFFQSLWGWDFQHVYHTTQGNSNNLPTDYYGFSRNGGNFNIYREQKNNSGNIDIRESTMEIIKYQGNLIDFPCDTSFNLTSNNLSTYNYFESYPVPKYAQSKPNLPFSNFTIQVAAASLSQYPYCGYNSVDTCALLSAKIDLISDTLCIGLNQSFHSISFLADSFAWYVNNQYISDSSSLVYNFSNFGNYSLKMEAFAANSPICFVSDSINIFIEDIPQLLSADTIICKGDTIQLISTNADSIAWSSTNGTFDCTNCLISNFTSNTNAILTWTGMNSEKCKFTQDILVKIYPKPKGTIAGVSSICPGSEDVEFSIKSPDSLLVNWWIDTVGIIVQGNEDSILTSWPNLVSSATVYAYIQNPQGCEGDTILFNVKVDTILNPQIIAPKSQICFNDRLDLTYNLKNPYAGSTFVWTASNASFNNYDSTSSINLDWDTTGNHYLIVQEFSSNNLFTCYGADTFNISIWPNPTRKLTPETLTPDICKDSAVEVICQTVPSGSKHIWYAEEALNSASFGNFFKASWSLVGNYLITVQEENNKGCRGPLDSLIVGVHRFPHTVFTVEDTVICYSDLNDHIYKATGLPQSTFEWKITSGDILEGNGTNEIKVNWYKTGGPKTLTIIETSEFGCTDDSVVYEFFQDVAYPYIFNTTVNPDSTITLDYQLRNKKNFPGSLLDIWRKSTFPQNTEWENIGALFEHLIEYTDHSPQSHLRNYLYRLEGENYCGDLVQSEGVSSIWLSPQSNYSNGQQQIELNWNDLSGNQETFGEYYVYKWNENEIIEIAQTYYPQFTIKNPESSFKQCFQVKLIHSDDLYESWSNPACIELDGNISIPNVITQNGDGMNEYFAISNLNLYTSHKLIIYDRSGRPLFESDNYSNNWPVQEINAGTYFYSLVVNTNSGSKSYKGWLEVLK